MESQKRRFGVIYIPPTTTVLTPIKEGTYTDQKGKVKTAFSKDEILFRRGTQSVTATQEEIAWIKRRALKQDYKMSVLSGQADEVAETLYSNLLEVKRLPDKIWTADERQVSCDYIPSQESKYIAYKRWNHGIVSFEDLSNVRGPLAFKVYTSSAKSHKLKDWLADPDKRRVIMTLLNKEVLLLARRLGMFNDSGDTGETGKRGRFGKIKIFYPCQGDERKESWISRAGISSTRTVAKSMYASQLHKRIFVHAAILPRFTEIGGQFFLQISQSMILTEDGRKATYGTAEGTVITRKTYNKYNTSYLNNLLFWIYKLSNGSESISLASGKVEVSAKPIEVKMDVGILSDRPAREIIDDFDIGIGEEEYAKI